MTDPHDHHTVAREDLEFSVKMALLKARRLWPKRRGPGDHDAVRIKLIAAAVVDHLALCGIRCIRKGPAPLHGTLAPRPSPRQDGAADEWDAGNARPAATAQGQDVRPDAHRDDGRDVGVAGLCVCRITDGRRADSARSI